MSRKIKYHLEELQKIWSEYQKSGVNLKKYCANNSLNYNSIYTALRKNKVMDFVKKNKKETAPITTETVVA